MPVGFRIASAWVEIHADDKGLKSEVEGAVQKAVKGVEAVIDLKINSKGLRKEVQDALTAATSGKKPMIDIGIRSTGLRKEVQDALKRATAGNKPTVKLGISSLGLRAEVQAALAAATAGARGEIEVDVDVDTDPIRRALSDQNLTINPDFDLQAMRRSLREGIEGINRDRSFNLRIHPDLDTFNLVSRVEAEMAALRDRFRVQVTPDVDTDTLAARLQAAARSLSHDDVALDFNPRVNQLQARAEAARAHAIMQERLRGGLEIRTEMNTRLLEQRLQSSIRNMDNQINEFTARMRNRGVNNLTFRARVDVDRSTLDRALADMNRGFDSAGGRMSRMAKIVLASVLLVPPALAVLNHALQVTGPSVGVLVAMFAALATMAATVMVGMNGVGEAIEQSGLSAKKYGEALERLSPNARAFVESVVESKGAFKDFQKVIQDTLFDDLAKEIRSMAKETIPSFTTGLGGMAMILNGMARGVMQTTVSLAKMGTLNAMFGGMQLAMEPLVPIPGQILNGLVKMSIAAMPLFIRMNTAMGNWFDDMTAKLNRAFANGSLQAAISKSGDDIVNFFRRIGNNPEWKQFVSHMQATGPEMARLFANISEALLKLVNNLSPIAGAILKIANAFAQMVVALPDGLIKTLLSIYAALKLWGLASAGVLALTRGITTLGSVLGALAGRQAMIAAIGPALARAGATAPAITALSVAVRGLAMAAGVFALIAGAVMLIDHISSSAAGAAPNVEKLGLSLADLAKSGKVSGELENIFGNLKGLREGLDTVSAGVRENIGWWDKLLTTGGQEDSAAGKWLLKTIDNLKNGEKSVEGFTKKIEGIDQALAGMVQSGHADIAAEAVKRMGFSGKESATYLDAYNSALAQSKLAQELAAQTMGLFGQKALEVSGRLKDLKSDTDGLVQSLFALNQTNRDSISAAREWETSADALVAVSKKQNVNLSYQNGMLSQNTELQREASTALEQHASNTEKSALAIYTQTGNWNAANDVMIKGRTAILQAGVAMGLTDTEARNLANAIITIPEQKQINVMMAGQAEEQLKAVSSAYKATPESKSIVVQTLNAAAITALEQIGYKVETLPDGSFQVTANTAPAEGDLALLNAYKITDKMVQVLANASQARQEVADAQAKVDDLKQKQAVAVGANKTQLTGEVNAAQGELDRLKQKEAAALKAVDQTANGVNSAKAALNSVQSKSVTITTTHKNIWLNTTPPGPYADGYQYRAMGGAIHRAMGGKIPKLAGGGMPGGFVSGPGGPTDDKVPAWLSNGEFVIKARSVAKYGMGFMHSLNAGRLNPGKYASKFASGGLASGGSYKIQSGDTLGALALRFKTTVKELMALNTNIKNANLIYAGQMLKLPGGGGTAPAKPSGPNQGLPPYVWPALSKFSSGLIENADKLSDMREWVTLSAESLKAGYVNAEAFHAINAGENMADLLKGIFEMKQKIRDTFKGSGETVLMDRMNLASDALIKWQAKLDPVNTSLTSAKEKLDGLQASFTQMKDSVKSNVMDSGKITKIGKWGTNPQTLLNQLQTDVGKAGAFAKQLEALKAKGVNSAMIQQIAEAGITGGGAATAGSVLQMTPEQIAQLNSLQTQLTANADKAGTAAANAMYGAGLQAAQGLVAGLEANKAAIEAAMAKIAHAMEDSIKQALGIKSPSRVMAAVGDFTVDGLLKPVIARKDEANQAIRALVPNQGIASDARAANFGGVTGTMGAASPTTVIQELHVHVEGTFDLSKPAERRNIASAIVVEMKEAIRVDDKRRR